MIGCPQVTLTNIYEKQVVRKANGILDCVNHPLHCLFEVLPSGRRFRVPGFKLNRTRSSFIPSAIRRRRQKRGCRAGALARRQPLKPPLPSLFLTNAGSLANKMDELRLQARANNVVKDSCILLITETWLHSSIPDSAIELAGYTAQRHDRTVNSGKSRGGGLCVYVNNSWCTNTVTVESHCSSDLEFVTAKMQEFTVVMITAVYIPPDANANSAIGLLHGSISSQQNKYPDAVQVITGDFNHADLKAALPKFHQHVKCATRGANTLDKVYSNIKLGYRARPLPHLGQSDHLSLLLIPAYAPLTKTAPTITKTVTTWPEGATQQLQDCFDRTNWGVFEHQVLEVFTDGVLCYIKNCIDTVTVDKRIRVYPNRKPWMNREVQQLLKERITAFKSGDKALYSTARANLKRGIRKVKADYRRRIEDHLDSNDSRQVWQGVQHFTNYRANLGAADGDIALAEELNLFFARFEVTPPGTASPHPTVHSSLNLTLLTAWCGDNNLLLNITKTKELIIDYRRKKTDIQPLIINGDCVERLADFHFLGVHIEEDLTWSVNTSELLKKAQQRLYFLRILRKNHTETAGVLLPSHHREHPYILHRCMVHQLHSGSEESAPEGHQHGPKKSLAALSTHWKNYTVPVASKKHRTS
ncbi:hypothetical protein N1851_014143 [Merluccius polli]|uniref:Alkylated DNA repair protein AlkB homologue 8 N-terminal domain-containing protein n=1 Tax=Merluccius polli TaxID=89951 RepID=A0AA47MUZ2_MERPO|nr:hypothetical protein N1851_014143 [Merluccius polli]